MPTLNRFFAIFMIFTLLLSACQAGSPPPAPGQPETPATPPNAPPAAPPSEPKINPPKPASPTPGLQAADDGEPLPPQVLQPLPQSEVSPTGPIDISFDQPMDAAATADALEVTDPNGQMLEGALSWPDARTLRFQPKQPLESGQLYFAGLSANAASAQGVKLTEPVSFQFQTTGPLEVSQVFPLPDAQDVDSQAVITVIFNRPVVPLVIAEEAANLPQPLTIRPTVEGQGEWVNTSVYVFRPSGFLNSGVQYTVTINPGLKDADGASSLDNAYSWSFSTATPGIDYFSVSDRYINPAGAKVLLLDDWFYVRFLQPMDAAAVENASSLSGYSGGYTFRWDDDSQGVSITPTQRLALGASYTLRVDGATNQGVPLEKPLEWQFKTVPAPAIKEVEPANGSAQGYYSGRLIIKFSSPMRIDTILPHIEVTPAPKQTDPQGYYSEWEWSYAVWLLEPSTEYVVRFTPGMEDIYGNRITTEKVVRFTTGKEQPYARLAMPYGPVIMRENGPSQAQQFYVAHANSGPITATLGTLTLDQVISFRNYSSDPGQYRIPSGKAIWQDGQDGSKIINQRQITAFQPQQNGSPLPAGFYFLALNAQGIPHDKSPYLDNHVLIVANAAITFKSARGQALAWVTDMESGQPIAGAETIFYDEKGSELARAATDKDGLAQVEIDAKDNNANYVLVNNAGVFGFADSSFGSGFSLYDYGIWSDFYAPAFRTVAYVYTERPIYRPGQPVYYKGIVRVDNDLNYRLPSDQTYHIRISNYDETVYDGETTLNDNGTFSGEFKLDPGAALGAYTIAVLMPQGDDENYLGSVDFNVAEYRKPEFQVQVSAAPENLLNGRDFTAQVLTTYYSGGGVGGAEVTWRLRAQPFTFQPPVDFSGYNFTDMDELAFYEYNDQGSSGESGVLADGQGLTSADGRFSLSLPASLDKQGQSQTLVFEADLTDLAQTTVSGRASVTAHRSQVYPGIQTRGYVGQEGKPAVFDLAALDWEGNILPNQQLSVEIVQRVWRSVQEQLPSGRVEWKSDVEEIPVQTIDDINTNAQGKAEVRFTPEKGGVYKARVTAQDAQGNRGSATAYLWVAGKDYIPWRQSNDRGFALITDKRSYQPGDIAEVLIASPMPGPALALVTVERGRIRYSEVVPLADNSTVVKLRITPDMAPNVYISAVVIKGVDADNPRPNFKTGVAQVEVATRQQELKVTLTPDKPQAAPGEQVRYTITTTSKDGSPVSAEVSLSLSDLATLSLLPPNSPPILDFFYNRRNLGVQTSVSLVQNIDEYNAEIAEEVQMGLAAGGGGNADLGVVAVRQNFPDTAFWDGAVQTDAAGQATVVVTLPDNLTTWRMEARAVTSDTRVGQTTIDIISTRPLLVRPQTPRFFVVNDQALLGAAVHNNTDAALDVIVSLQAEGLESTSPISQAIGIPAKSQRLVTWNVNVLPEAQRVDLVFRAAGGGYEDSSRPPAGVLENQGLPVYRYEAPESVGTSGMLTEGGTKVEGVLLPQSMTAGSGQLTIRLQPSLAAGMTDSLAFLKDYPYECVEQTISRFLPNILAVQAMQAAGVNDPALKDGLEEQVNSALQRLAAAQLADGGWGWWSGADKSDPLVSAYAVLGLVEASDAGYSVSAAMLDKAVSYLRDQIVGLNALEEPHTLNRQVFILYVLARAGAPNISATVQVFEQRRSLQIYVQAFLAQTLAWIDPGDGRVATLRSNLANQAVVSASGTHWEEATSDTWNWNTDTRTTAIVLSVLSNLDANNPINANAVRWLMSHRIDGHWLTTQENAWTLLGLTRWMKGSGELQANYTYAVGLNGETLGAGEANSDTLRQTLELKVDIHNMLPDALNRLAITRQAGAGNLYYTAYLNVTLPVEQIQPLARGITVSRSYYRLDDLTTPVTQTQQGELLLTRLTLVAPNSLHYVVVDDPLPAGFEAVDQSLATSPQTIEIPKQISSQDLAWRGFGWWAFDHIQYKDEKVILSAQYLPAGTYVYTYLVRAGAPGQYRVIPTTASEFYFPEVYGRGAGMLFTIQP